MKHIYNGWLLTSNVTTHYKTMMIHCLTILSLFTHPFFFHRMFLDKWFLLILSHWSTFWKIFFLLFLSLSLRARWDCWYFDGWKINIWRDVVVVVIFASLLTLPARAVNIFCVLKVWKVMEVQIECVRGQVLF